MDYKTKRDALLRKLEEIEARDHLDLLESTLDQRLATQSYGSPMADAFPSEGVNSLIRPRSRAWDRSEGRHLPLYQVESDLEEMRARCRALATFDSLWYGASTALRVYVMGGEWEYEVTARKGVEPAANLVGRCQYVIDRFIEENEWSGALDAEVHDQVREDGDCLVALYPRPSGRAKVVVHNADKITAPANCTEINQAAGVSDGICNFGVHAKWDEQVCCYDYSEPLGYFVSHDDGVLGAQDYIPRLPMLNLQDARCGTLIKRNTPRSAARGWSDFAVVADDMDNLYQLRYGTTTGATALSHIAYIIENAPGTGSKQAIDSNDPTARIQRYLSTKGGAYGESQADSAVRQKHIPPKSRLSVPPGAKYHAGPLGASHAPVFMDVGQFGLRILGVRWLLPEYMISGDASNSAYASTVAARSPFVKAREDEQSRFTRVFRQLAMKALRISYLSGQLDDVVGSWEELVGQVELKVSGPQVASDDKTAEVNRNQILYQNGILSKRAWAVAEGLDPDDMPQAEMEAEVEAGGEPGSVPGSTGRPSAGVGSPQDDQPSGPSDEASGEYMGLSRLQWQRNRKAIQDVLGDVQSGSKTAGMAKAELAMLGLSSARITELLSEVQPVTEQQRYELATKLLFENYP